MIIKLVLWITAIIFAVLGINSAIKGELIWACISVLGFILCMLKLEINEIKEELNRRGK